MSSGGIIAKPGRGFLIGMAAMAAFLGSLEFLAAAEPEQQASSFLEELTHPWPWLNWSMELRLRDEYRQNAAIVGSNPPDREANYLRLRARLEADLAPVTNLVFSARLATEPRYYTKSLVSPDWTGEEALLDVLRVRWQEPMGTPATVTLGRQEIIFGNRWLIWDGTPGDGSRTEFFDAARLTWEWRERQTTLDVIGLSIENKSDARLPVINDRGVALSEQDEQAAILYLANTALPGTRLEGFFIFRETTAAQANGDNATEYVSGGRGVGRFSPRWEYRAEAAVQLGEKNGSNLRAFGGNGQVALLAGGRWEHRLHVGYEHLSGDDPATDTDEGWDPVWGRRAQWSELMIFTFALESQGRRGYWSNLGRPNIGWTAKPRKWLELNASYMPLLANSNPQAGSEGFGEGLFRGHYLQTIARFKLGPRITSHLWGEYFWPGDYYSSAYRDNAVFLRAEVNFSL